MAASPSPPRSPPSCLSASLFAYLLPSPSLLSNRARLPLSPKHICPVSSIPRQTPCAPLLHARLLSLSISSRFSPPHSPTRSGPSLPLPNLSILQGVRALLSRRAPNTTQPPPKSPRAAPFSARTARECRWISSTTAAYSRTSKWSGYRRTPRISLRSIYIDRYILLVVLLVGPLRPLFRRCCGV